MRHLRRIHQRSLHILQWLYVISTRLLIEGRTWDRPFLSMYGDLVNLLSLPSRTTRDIRSSRSSSALASLCTIYSVGGVLSSSSMGRYCRCRSCGRKTSTLSRMTWLTPAQSAYGVARWLCFQHCELRIEVWLSVSQCQEGGENVGEWLGQSLQQH